MIPKRLAFAMAGALACTSLASASISTLELSQFSSEPGVDPSLLSATMDFSVAGSTLTLTVTNNTLVPNEFNINRVYFNASDSVGNLVSSSLPAGWAVDFNMNANGFGIFDFELNHGPPQGHNHHLITPGGSKVYSFTFDGIGFSVKDFTTELSAQFDSNMLMVVAAKFVQGPGDASAFGATVPEPGVIALLGIAGAMGVGRRRRRT